MTDHSRIEGDGFILRQFEDEDAEAIAEIEFDSEVKRFLALPTRPRSEWIREVKNLGIRGWVIQMPDGRIAGNAALDRAQKGVGELRVVIGKPFWGSGLGRKVAGRIVQVAFEQLSAKAIVAVVHPKNKASLRLVRSLGFRRRGLAKAPCPEWQVGHYIYRLPRNVYNQQVNRTRQKQRAG